MKQRILVLFGLIVFCLISKAECTAKKPVKCPTQKELNELTLILTKYSNNPEGLPPLHYAIAKNDRRAISLFLKHGADPLSVCSNHYSCLYYAIKSGSLSLIKKFIALGNNPIDLWNRNAEHGYDALTMSLKLGQYEAVKYFILNSSSHPKRLALQGALLLKPNACGFTIQQRKELVGLMVTHKNTAPESASASASLLLEKLLHEAPREHEMADFLRSLGAK